MAGCGPRWFIPVDFCSGNKKLSPFSVPMSGAVENQQGSASPEGAGGAGSRAWDCAGWWGDILTVGGISVFQVFL